MAGLEPSRVVFLFAIAIYTLATAYTDIRSRRIPNAITAPMCLAGLVYQFVFFGGQGVIDGLLGFSVGFGILFVLWMIGSAGGGDVKLMGGLGAWLGAPLTLRVLLCSVIFVAIGTVGMMFCGVVSQGWRKTRASLAAPQPAKVSGGPQGTSSKRRLMAFAVPVALATWCVLALFRTQW